jgi:hypothetical protein
MDFFQQNELTEIFADFDLDEHKFKIMRKTLREGRKESKKVARVATCKRLATCLEAPNFFFVFLKK